MADIEIFFVTNRDLRNSNAAPWFGSRFNHDGPFALRFGTATGQKAADGSYQLTGVEIAPERLTQLDAQNRVVGSRVVFDALRRKMLGPHGSDTLVLIHGYASTFQTALERGIQIADVYRPKARPLNVVVFSWPSNGEMVPVMSYLSDRDDARDTGEAMARGILLLRDFIVSLTEAERCDRSIHILAHSMGNYALRYGVQHLRRYLGDTFPRLFGEIVLAAADEDDDAFDVDHKLRLLPALCRRVSVYHAAQDRALVVSDITKGNPDRLGSDGPKQISGLPTKVSLVDCREVALADDRWTGHQYYRLNARVVGDIVSTLEGLAADQIADRRFIADFRTWRIRGR